MILWKSDVTLRACFKDLTTGWMIGFGLDLLRFMVVSHKISGVDGRDCLANADAVFLSVLRPNLSVEIVLAH